MENKTKINCEILGNDHLWDFFIAAHGVQTFKCTECGEIDDVTEDSQP